MYLYIYSCFSTQNQLRSATKSIVITNFLIQNYNIHSHHIIIVIQSYTDIFLMGQYMHLLIWKVKTFRHRCHIIVVQVVFPSYYEDKQKLSVTSRSSDFTHR